MLRSVAQCLLVFLSVAECCAVFLGVAECFVLQSVS